MRSSQSPASDLPNMQGPQGDDIPGAAHQVPLCPAPPPGPAPEQARIPLRHALLPRSKSRGGSRGKNRTRWQLPRSKAHKLPRQTQTQLRAHARPECTKPSSSSPSPLLSGWRDPVALHQCQLCALQPPASSGPGQAFPGAAISSSCLVFGSIFHPSSCVQPCPCNPLFSHKPGHFGHIWLRHSGLRNFFNNRVCMAHFNKKLTLKIC